MTTLREAAQQALEALLTPSGAQACSTCQNGPENEYCCRMEMWSAVDALRSALAQQDEPQGCATEEDCTKQPWCRIRGECQRKQAQPVEPVAWLAPDGSVRETPAAKSFGEWVWGPDDFKPLYTAPPQRKPLTEEEIEHIGITHQSLRQVARAVERAVWEKNHG